MDKTCSKIRDKYDFKFGINAILPEFVYNRVLDPASKRSAFKMAQDFLEPPTYELHDVYRTLSILAKESDLIQTDCYKKQQFSLQSRFKDSFLRLSKFLF